MNFTSDNVTPANKQIIDEVTKINQGYESSYGQDNQTQLLEKKLSEIFETPVNVFLVNTGTAANCLALSALVRPHEAILCHTESHIATDEGNAPEFFTGGAKIITCGGKNGKLNADNIDHTIVNFLNKRPIAPKIGCISLTQATEAGTVYTLDELTCVKTIANQHKLSIHMDGARFANSLVSLGCSPAELTWKSGIDVLSFGATKNGTICAEAIVFFNPVLCQEFDYLHKRAGQLMSKNRFFACQLNAYLRDDLWLKNAGHANKMAKKLENILLNHNFLITYPVESNEIFFTMSKQIASQLREKGCQFYDWLPTPDLYRFVTSFYTSQDDIDKFEKTLKMITTP